MLSNQRALISPPSGRWMTRICAMGLAAIAIGAHANGGDAIEHDDVIARGAYLARAADCASCHTAEGGVPYGGGRAIDTPFGAVYAPNITPDDGTGIGRWSESQFYRAVHDGIGRDGRYLYPVMPFTFYTRMPREDVDAIYRYLFSLPAVHNRVHPNALRFPYDIRDTMAAWRELYFRPGVYVPDPAQDERWNRGAYLVTGPGHCGACHSPRSDLGGIESSRRLTGGDVEHWFAPNLTTSLRSGLGTWSEADIVSFLQTGTVNGKGTAVGPMSEVVRNSLSHLREADLKAIAVYLKSLPPGTPATPSERRASHGARLYVDNCMPCHQAGGAGVPSAIPALKGNGVVNADDPADLMKVVLQGVPGRGKYPTMPSFADRLSDGQIADVLNYVRSRWGNSAPQNVTPSLVGLWRGYSATGPDGTEAVQRLECPRISISTVLGTVEMSDAELKQLDADLEGGGEGERIGYTVRRLQEQHPDWTYSQIANALLAAYCPVVANSGLDHAAKLARLRRFTQVMREALTRNHVHLSLAPEQAYPTIPGSTRNVMLKANPRAAGHSFLCPATPASDRDLVEVVRADLEPYGSQLLANDFSSVPEVVAQVRRQRPAVAPEHLIPASALAFCPLVEADTGSETHAKPDYNQRVSTWMRFAERVARASLTGRH